MGCDKIPPSCAPFPPRSIPPFCGFTEFVPTIPKLYWQVPSQEQRIIRICELIDKVICYVDYLGDNVNADHDSIVELQRLFEKFIESGFDDYYAEQIEKWIGEHLEYIYAQTVAQVFFTVDDSGYLIAHVPDGWNQIQFSTPMDYDDQSSYGRLCLTYAFDASQMLDYRNYMEV